ncbi:hypothetical protein CDD83_244 [Cordyceps sp. RAO-2017]|nr:hypothetical protein CDD83_244 [Cordyceps sp. RAO-2017]
MRAAFDKGSGLPSPKMLSPRLLPRRSVVALVVASLFVAGLLVTSGRLGARCDDGVYCGLSQLRHRPAAPRPPPAPPSAGTESARPVEGAGAECAGFPDTSRVLLVMKTGASEVYGKVPNQILTNLRCLPEFFIFSDRAQKVAGYSIRDSLDTVLPQVKLKHKDFDLYRRQQSCPVDQDACNKHHDAAQEGWNLDKYKNVHMAEKTYALRPDYDWYLFVDADTYVGWPTLMRWLEKLDAREPHYIGSIAYVGNVPFAHGGSGYLVSQAAMTKLFKNQTGVANRWDERASRECCGDFVFALALKAETQIAVKHAWPTINGEKPHTLPYADNAWCQPIVTMHHVGAEEVSDLYAFERERNFSQPMRIRDVYHRFVKDQLTATRDDWDNLSDNVFFLNASAYQYADWELQRAKKEDLSALELVAHQSFDDCRRACQSMEKCLQFRFYHGICAISDSIKHGHPTKKEEDQHWQYQSGWNLRRIEEWVAAHDDCGAVQFPIRDGWLRR